MKKALSIKKVGAMLIVDGKAFQPSRITKRTGYEMIFFKPISERRFRKLVASATEKLKSSINSKDILMSALSEMSLRELENINAELKRSKPKVKKTDGCLELHVGKNIIPIR